MIKRILAIVLSCAAITPGVRAEDATLAWSNGDSLAGRLVSADDKVLVWESSLFSDPLQINLASLSAVKFPKTENKSETSQGFRVLMKNGDVLFGDLKEIGEQTLRFEGARKRNLQQLET